MSSHPNPFSVGTKSSKYTLSKRGLSKKHNKNTITLLDKNIVLNYPSDFVKYKQQKPLSKKSNIICPSSTIHYSKPHKVTNKKGNNTLNKTTKKDFASFNSDFIQFCQQLDLIKKSAMSTNRTYYNPSSERDKVTLINTIYTSSISHSKKKQNETKPKYSNKKKPPTNIKINNTNTSSLKKGKQSKNSKKGFNTFNPFHIQFSKPLNVPHKNIKNKTTYKEPNIQHYQDNTKKLKQLQNKTTDVYKKFNISNNENVKKLNQPVKEIYKISNTTIEQRKEVIVVDTIEDDFLQDNYISDNGNEDESEDNSGVLAYDEVKDIIIYYNMNEVYSKFLFTDGDYEKFSNERKNKYIHYFRLNQKENFNYSNTKINDTKSPSTNPSSKTKTNYVSVNKQII